MPSNTLDNDFETRWSAEGDQWIDYDLGSLYTISYLKIAFYQGDQRVSYFSIYTSTDGNGWTLADSTQSSGTSASLETYEFADLSGRYVRIYGHGNSSSDWNSISEVEIYGTVSESLTQFTLSTSVAGSGSIQLSPAGGVYDSATVVIVTAIPESGYHFEDWGGDLSGNTNPDTLIMTGNKSISASFSSVSWTQITYENFESGFGTYRDGGSCCELYTGGIYAYEGSNAARIWNNNGNNSAFWHINGFDADTPGYVALRVIFSYYPSGLSSTGHVLKVVLNTDDTWTLMATYAYQVDFPGNDQFYTDTLYIYESSYVFDNNMELKFVCDAGSDATMFYVDDIEVSGSTSLPKMNRVEEKAGEQAIPVSYTLANYPNPFNPSTNIQFGIPESGYVEITIYDIMGRKVFNVYSGEKEAGLYTYSWHAKNDNGTSLSSGVYFLNLRARNYQKTVKLMYMR